MKKFLAVALSVLMLMSIIPLTAMATDEYDFVFDFEASKTQVVAGDVVDVTISVTGTETAKSAGWQFELLLPEGLEYVANSGKVNAETKAALNAGEFSFEEGTHVMVCVEEVGIALQNTNKKNEIMTLQVKVADTAKVGDKLEIAAYDWLVMDGDAGELDAAKYQLNYATLEVVDHICSADKLTYVEAVAADCENDGNVAYYECECGTKYVDEAMSEIVQDVIVPAPGHTAAEAVEENRVEADCENDGSYDMVVYCSVCNEELSRESFTINAPGHTAAEAVEENRVEADCENDGSYDMVVYCSVCDKELSRESFTIDALGHKAAEAVEENRKEADCVNEGSYDMVVYCSVCDEELSRESFTIDALGHDYESVVTAPTCTEAGYTTYTCSACGDTYTADQVAAIGHSIPAKELWVESTTEKGWFYGYCENDCGYFEKELRTIYVDGIDLIQENLPLHYVRKEVATILNADISPIDASEDYKITWTSSNEDVVTVDENGNVTTHKHGNAVITVTVEKEDGTTYTDTCNVKVRYTWWQCLIWLFLIGCAWYFV